MTSELQAVCQPCDSNLKGGTAYAYTLKIYMIISMCCNGLAHGLLNAKEEDHIT
jgi:hypothetical protein